MLSIRVVIGIPGGTSARLDLLDDGLRPRKTWTFQIGWRNFLGDVTFRYSLDFSADLLTIDSKPVINGRDIGRLYFTIRDEELRLIRIENRAGLFHPNHYAFENYEIGVIPKANSAEEWAGLLSSKMTDDVLSALVFLSGKHSVFESKSKYLDAHRSLLSNAEILGRLATLARSENAWIREAATGALAAADDYKAK